MGLHSGGGRRRPAAPRPQHPDPAPSEATFTRAGHCNECRCRCRCHEPLRPDPPPTETPPQPGDPGWSAYIAVLSAKVGSLEGAYALLNHGTDTPAT
jgi:hypothetical protein